MGGYWGLYDAAHRLKFVWGQPVSNAPLWKWQAAAGVLLALLVVLLAMQQQRSSYASITEIASTGVVACSGGLFAAQALEASLTEGLGIVGWTRSSMQAAVAILTPMAVAWALGRGVTLPALQDILGPRERRRRDAVSLLLGLSVIMLAAVAVESALGLVFNARYLDFPYAALTSAAVPLFVLSLRGRRDGGVSPLAERVIATLLAVSAVRIVWAETLANWQALWLAATFVLLAATLLRARAAPG